MSSAITSLLLCPSNQCFSFSSRSPTSGYSNGVTRKQQRVVLCSIVRSQQNASEDEVERIGIRRRDAMLQMACSAFLSATTLSISSPAHSLEDVPGELRLFFDDVNKYNISILEAEGTGENVLAKHVAFFDRNHDGVVYPWETFQGFRAIGSGLLLSTVAGFVINIGLSQKTRPGKFPSLLFPIEIKNIAKAKHGSDSGVYDTEGRFVPAKFNAIFSKHANSNPNALTGKELDEMLKANRQPKDYPGRFAAYIEWKILYNLCKDKNGLLQKDTVRGVYDGSLFEKMEMEINSAKKPKHG